jgi:methyl-accepting chemotaxis protein
MSKRLGTMSLSTIKDESDSATIAGAEASVRGVLEGFGELATQLSGSVAQLESEHGKIRDQVSDALVALQFQDRVSQITSHVHTSLDEMSSRLDAGTEDAVDLHEWSSQSRQRYSTYEEFDNHEGAREPAARVQEVTFF